MDAKDLHMLIGRMHIFVRLDKVASLTLLMTSARIVRH